MQTILVADDRRSHRQAFCDQLSQAGFDTLQASNGLEVITLFKAHHPDLIILDVDMPEMNGFETCRVIRQTSDVPVLFLTGVMTEVADEEHGMNRIPYPVITVHDAFACHARVCDDLNQKLRDNMEAMYRDLEPLAGFLAQTEGAEFDPIQRGDDWIKTNKQAFG